MTLLTAEFGTQCLMARRMVERGVRFVQLYSGGNKGGSVGWDARGQCNQNHSTMAGKVDRPIAGLLADLKSRGLLQQTLVVWGGDYVHDLHATILTLLGLDHQKLTYLFQERDFRLTDVGGQNNLASRLTV
jgi:hypothetical protein